jgi:hypothetical protein
VSCVNRSSLFLLLLKRKLEGASWPLFFRPAPLPFWPDCRTPGTGSESYRPHRSIPDTARQHHVCLRPTGSRTGGIKRQAPTVAFRRYGPHCHISWIAPCGKPVLQTNPVSANVAWRALQQRRGVEPHGSGTNGHRYRKASPAQVRILKSNQANSRSLTCLDTKSTMSPVLTKA